MLENLHHQRQSCLQASLSGKNARSQIDASNTSIITRRTQASLLRGHSACDPPDPISNSDVKPGSADGTSAKALEE